MFKAVPSLHFNSCLEIYCFSQNKTTSVPGSVGLAVQFMSQFMVIRVLNARNNGPSPLSWKI